ncbi:MAG TPA: tetratricopeptide repeat protein, partial [bacterium]|nr:tetratricopeptide repeat protein [bacterium]
AMQEILPQLKESKRRPLANRIAKALCLSADGRYDEALTELDQIQAILSAEDAPVSDRDESKDLPLYRTAVLLFQGQDYDAARDAFRDYMARNADDPEHLLFRSRNLTYGMDETPSDIRRIAEFTRVLVNSDLMATKEARAKLPMNLAASILEKHRESLGWRYETEESNRLAMLIMDEYYPQTLSGANAAMNFAAYIALDKGDLDGGRRLLNHILENAPYDGVVPHVKRVLAQIALREKKPDTAMELTNETLERVGPLPEGGPLKRCLENALQTRAAATSLKNPEGVK